jgi:hypothetical protein
MLRDEVLSRRVVREAREVLARDYAWPDVAATTVATYERASAEERELQQATRPELRMVVRGGNLLRDAT